MEFILNSAGCCVNPERVVVYARKGHYFCEITLASKRDKWVHGYDLRSPMGFGGCSVSGACFGQYREKFDSRDKALAAGLLAAKRFFDLTEVPDNYPDNKTRVHILTLIDQLLIQTQNLFTMAPANNKSKNTSLPPLPGIGAGLTVIPESRFMKLSELSPDPNQPRKHFNAIEDADLLASVKSQGILQALLVRPKSASELLATDKTVKTPFVIICGERRYRAALEVIKADSTWFNGTVPVVIRPMNDEEAMEAQIVENLQRKDVHPMEEALAFESLTKRGLTQEQIGARVGKGDRFVRARLILCSLSKVWQDLFFRHAIDLELALKICRYSDALQAQILKDQEISKKDMERPDLKISFKDFSAYRGNLVDASFDITDPTLNPKMGSCIGCQFNSATASLFPDDQKQPRCMNLECFRIKSDKGFNDMVTLAKTDPSICLVKLGYRSDDDKVVKKLKEQKLTVLEHGQFNEQDLANPGTYDEWEAKSRAGDYTGSDWEMENSDEENRKVYEREVADFEKDQKTLAAGIKSGKFKKALVVSGDDDHAKGTLVVIELTKPARSSGGSSSTSSSSQSSMPLTSGAKIKAGKGTARDFDAEIERIQKDIDDTKKRQVDNAHVALVQAFKASPISHAIADKPATKMERLVLALYLLEELGGADELVFYASDTNDDMGHMEKLAKALGMGGLTGKKKKNAPAWDRAKNAGMDINKPTNREAVWKFVSELTEPQIALVFRQVVLHKFGGSLTVQIPSSYKSGEAWIMRKMIEAWDGTGPGMIDIKAVELEAKERADKRIKNAQKRIGELKEQKAELGKKKEAKATTPKPAAKKAAIPKKEAPAKAAKPGK